MGVRENGSLLSGTRKYVAHTVLLMVFQLHFLFVNENFYKSDCAL